MCPSLTVRYGSSGLVLEASSVGFVHLAVFVLVVGCTAFLRLGKRVRQEPPGVLPYPVGTLVTIDSVGQDQNDHDVARGSSQHIYGAIVLELSMHPGPLDLIVRR